MSELGSRSLHVTDPLLALEGERGSLPTEL
jgi:hypothetical protein